MSKTELSNIPASDEVGGKGEGERRRDMSIIVPTYNEARNIIKLIDAIRTSVPSNISAEIIVVDDNSPDGTGGIIDQYRCTDTNTNRCPLKVLHRHTRSGLISAILAGIRFSTGNIILIMDADFSHPPEVIPTILKELKQDPSCVVVASRYMRGGSIIGWPYRRKIISNLAVILARRVLKLCKIADPMSGFFAFPRQVIDDVRFETNGYKFLLELLVKSRSDVRVVEIPYTFVNRKYGESKLDVNTIVSYVNAIWTLYRYGRKSAKSNSQIKQTEQKRRSVLFLSKAARFFTVGASGLLINYVISYLLSSGVVSNIGYMQATIIGIAVSITTNFILNKVWTFEDTDFSLRHVLRQYGTYLGFASVGALVQLSLLYALVESSRLEYGLSLLIAVAAASISNFIMNKKWTFGEKIWG